MNPRPSATLLAAAAIAAMLTDCPAMAQIDRPIGTQTMTPGRGTGYADLADLVIAAPLIADAAIRSAVRLKGADAAGVAPGHTRFYVEADLVALVKGAGGLPPRIGYLAPTVARKARPPPSFELIAASERASEPCSQSCASTGSVSLACWSCACRPSSTSCL